MLHILVAIALGKTKIGLFTTHFPYEVELVFIEKGHTQNANDTMHSLIENAKSPNTPYHVTVKAISLIIRPLKKTEPFFRTYK